MTTPARSARSGLFARARAAFGTPLVPGTVVPVVQADAVVASQAEMRDPAAIARDPESSPYALLRALGTWSSQFGLSAHLSVGLDILRHPNLPEAAWPLLVHALVLPAYARWVSALDRGLADRVAVAREMEGVCELLAQVASDLRNAEWVIGRAAITTALRGVRTAGAPAWVLGDGPWPQGAGRDVFAHYLSALLKPLMAHDRAAITPEAAERLCRRGVALGRVSPLSPVPTDWTPEENTPAPQSVAPAGRGMGALVRSPVSSWAAPAPGGAVLEFLDLDLA